MANMKPKHRTPTHARFRRQPEVDEDVIPNMWRVCRDEIIHAGKYGCYEAMRWGSFVQVSYFGGTLPEYCPHCGTRMEVEDDD